MPGHPKHRRSPDEDYQCGSDGTGAVTQLSFDGAVKSAALGAGVRALRLMSPYQDCHIRLGLDPTAAVTDFHLKAGTYVVWPITAATLDALGVADTTLVKVGAIKATTASAGVLQIEKYT